jgi:hypothetical protein
VPCSWSISKVVLKTALAASAPAQRWKQHPVAPPQWRSMSTLAMSSAGLAWMWVKRLTAHPASGDSTWKSSLVASFWAQS